jgi:hypothetical protein
MVARGAALAEMGIRRAERILNDKRLVKKYSQGTLTGAGEALESVQRLIGGSKELKDLLKKLLCVTKRRLPAAGMRSRFLLDGSFAAHRTVPSSAAKRAKKR